MIQLIRWLIALPFSVIGILILFISYIFCMTLAIGMGLMSISEFIINIGKKIRNTKNKDQ